MTRKWNLPGVYLMTAIYSPFTAVRLTRGARKIVGQLQETRLTRK